MSNKSLEKYTLKNQFFKIISLFTVLIITSWNSKIAFIMSSFPGQEYLCL